MMAKIENQFIENLIKDYLVLKKPKDKNAIIWRYINFAKFMSLMQKRKFPSFLFWSILVVILITGCFCCEESSYLPEEQDSKGHLSEEAKAFLSLNSVFLDIFDNNDFLTFSMIDPYAQDNTVFFTGEQHATQKNYDVRFKFLKYFNQTDGIRYYLAEAGYGNCCIVNRYFETGYEEYIRKIMNPLKGTANYTMETFEFWKKVRNYNLSTQEDERIIFIGVDVEHQVDTGVFALYLLLPANSGNEPPFISMIKDLFAELDAYDFKRENYRSGMFDDIRTLIMNISGELEADETPYRDYLGDDFFDFVMIVNNCLASYSFYDSGHDKRIREEAIYTNFLKVYENLPDFIPKRFYGQWGGYHIYQESLENDKRFATMLQHRNESPVKEKVISIKILYHRSLYLDKKTGEPNRITYESGYSKELSELALGDVTLFKLVGESSPFERQRFFITTDLEKEGCVTTDYFQFIILILDSPAARRWEQL